MRPHYECYEFCPRCGKRYGDSHFDADEVAFRCHGCGYVFYQNPLPSATAVIPRLGRPSEVVLITRKGGPRDGLLALPGGLLRYGETPEACARRETLEETQIAIEIEAPLAVIQVGYEYQGGLLMILEHAFLAAPIDRDLAGARSEEAHSIGFYDVANPGLRDDMAFAEQMQVLETYEARIGQK